MERGTKTPTTSEGQPREICLRDTIRDDDHDDHDDGRHQVGAVATLAALVRNFNDHAEHVEHYAAPASQRADCAASRQSCYCYCLGASLKFIGLICCWCWRRRRQQLIRSSKCEQIVSNRRRPRGRRRPAEVSAAILVALLLLLGLQQHQHRQSNAATGAAAVAAAAAATLADEDSRIYPPPPPLPSEARPSREAAQIRDSGATNVVLENNNQSENNDNNNNNNNSNNNNDNEDDDDDEAPEDDSSSSSSNNNNSSDNDDDTDDINIPDELVTDGDADMRSNHIDVQESDTSSSPRGGGGGYLNIKLRECEARNLKESQAAEKAEKAAAADSDSGPSDGTSNSSSSSSEPNLIGGIREEVLENIFQWVIYSIFGTLFLIGTSTNAITLYAVGRKRTLTPMDIYIIMLAINDLIYCLLALPIPVLYVLYYGEWVFGLFTCKMTAFLTSFSVHNSSMTVVNIAQLRFRLVVHPFEPGVTTLKAYLRTLISCSMATLITIPYVLVVHLKIDQSLCVILCDEYWGKGEQAKWYRFSFSLFTTTVQFLLPLIGFEYYYKPIRDQLINLEKTHIVRHGVARQPQQQQQAQQHQPHQLELSEIKSSSALALNQLPPPQPLPPPPPSTSSAAGHYHQQIGNHSTSNNNNNNNSNNNNNNAGPTTTTTATTAATTTATTTATATGGNAISRERIRQMNLLSRLKQTRKVVYFFSLTWLPLNVFNLISIWVESSTLYMYLHLVCQAAACCSVCLNPIMYPLSNDNYRQEFEHILPACLLRKLDSLLKA